MILFWHNLIHKMIPFFLICWYFITNLLLDIVLFILTLEFHFEKYKLGRDLLINCKYLDGAPPCDGCERHSAANTGGLDSYIGVGLCALRDWRSASPLVIEQMGTKPPLKQSERQTYELASSIELIIITYAPVKIIRRN